jgi:hypothetical protein
MSADDKAIEVWDVQEIGHPKKTCRPRKRHVLKGVPTTSNSNILSRLVVHGEQSTH